MADLGKQMGRRRRRLPIADWLWPMAGFVALAAASACALDKVAAPTLTGPSEFSVSLGLTATPDVIAQDGVSSAVISVFARDAASQPIRGLSLRVDTFVDGVAVDFGSLSAKTVSTGSDGRASVSYFAPPAPPPTVSSDTVVVIALTPIGTDYSNATPRSVAIRLARPGVILPPNGTPLPAFFFSPTSPRENESVQFDGSASRDDGQIVAYEWNFGDGRSGSGVRPTHAYEVVGAYQITLTVTDDRGIRASTAPATITVVAAADPVASFTNSPTNPTVGTSISFNAAASTVPAGRQIVSYHWDFGDGQQATGVTAHHTYTLAKTYTITLMVIDNTGRKGVVSRTVTVLP